MASIEKRTTTSGVTYRITVSAGVDPVTGDRIRHRMTYTPEPTMTAKQARKAAERAAVDFERKIEKGYVVDAPKTFAELVPHALNAKKVNSVRTRTLERYDDLLVRIIEEIGNIPLNKLHPVHLNDFYSKLMTPGIRNCPGHSTAKIDLAAVLKERHMSRAKLADICGLSAATIGEAVRGKSVTAATADAIATALEMKTAEVFEITYDLRPLSKKTVLEYHRLIHSILEYAITLGWVEYNVADRAAKPKQDPPNPNYYEPELIIKIMEALDSEPLLWCVLTNLLAITAARRGEICALKWRNIDFSKHLVYIYRGLVSTREFGLIEDNTKQGDFRVLELPVEFIEMLQELRDEQTELKCAMGIPWNEDDYIFTTNMVAPIHPDSITHWVPKFAERHNLPHLNPHAFRHSAATLLLSKGYDVATVAKYLGHSLPSTTLNYYAHVLKMVYAQTGECIADETIRKKHTGI